MSVIRYLAAPALFACSSLAMAAGFNGFSVQLGAGMGMAQTELTNYSPDGTVGDNSAFGNLALNYSKAFGQFNLAGGLFMQLGNMNSGSLRSFAADTGGVWSDSFKLKKIWGVSIEPGFNLSPSTLVYGKFSYVQASGENTYDYGGGDAGSATRKHGGFGYGVGARFNFSSNLYGMIEVEQVQFDSKSYYNDVPETYKPSMLRGIVGVGYRFF